MQTTTRCARRFIVFLCAFLFPLLLAGQDPRGTLRGIIQDPSGGRIASARISVRALDSSLQREAVGDDSGEFRLDSLLPGLYTLSVNANGFAEASSQVKVAIGSVRELVVTLKASSVRETVTVRAGSSSITTQPFDTASAIHQAIV